MTITDTPADIEDLFLADLRVREDQKYRLEDKSAIALLAGSIAQTGLLHNLCIDPDNNICSGTRRYGALKLNKHKGTVPCRRVSKELADAIVLAGNHAVVQPDPMRESGLVKNLLSQPGWTLKDVATTMGWDVRRVALLQRLQDLSPLAKEALETPNHYMQAWPIDWIEEFAQLAPEAQTEAIKENKFQYVRSKDHLDGILAQHFHVLGKASWDLYDAGLVPEAGSCSACPKQSGNTPGLFDDALDEKDVKKFTCQDNACWLKKASASAGRRITALREKNPDSVVVADFSAKERLPILREHPTFMEHQVATCGKTEKGAVPAIFVKGDGSISRMYVRKPAETATPSKAPRVTSAKVELSQAQKEEMRAEKLVARRKQWIVNDIIVKLREWDDDKRPLPDHIVIMGFVAAYRVEQPLTENYVHRNIHGNAKARKELYALNVHHKKFDMALWPRLVADLILSISSSGGDSLDDEYDEALWLAGVLDLGREVEFSTKAEEAVPTPKSMQPKPPKAAKKKAKAVKGKKEKPAKRKTRAEDGHQPEND